MLSSPWVGILERVDAGIAVFALDGGLLHMNAEAAHVFEPGQPIAAPLSSAFDVASKTGGVQRVFGAADRAGGAAWNLVIDAWSGAAVVVTCLRARPSKPLDSTDDFLAVVSHELRTPLVPLVGYADALRKIAAERDLGGSPGWDSRVSEFVAKFHKQLKHLEKLTDDLLDYARLESGKFALDSAPVELAALLARAVEQARMRAPERDIELVIEASDAVVWGDEARLMQAITNLLTNALRHAGTSPRYEVGLRRALEGSDVLIEVVDYGPGIALAEQRGLFSRLRTPRRPRGGGLGLGLYIAHTIATQHGGGLTVRSAIAKGSTFQLRLPLFDDAGHSQPPSRGA